MAPPSVLPPPFFLRVSSGPADWEHHKDPKKCAFPKLWPLRYWANKCHNRDFRDLPDGWFRISQIVLPNVEKASNQSWSEPFTVANMLMWRSRLEAMILVQLKVAQRGVATSSEKCTVVAHSAHTQVRFIAVTWEVIRPLDDMEAKTVMIATTDPPHETGRLAVKTYLQFSIFCHGTWPTQEPRCRLQ